MKYIKKFEGYRQLGLEKIYDLSELDNILIDFKQMGLDYDIKAGSSIVIDWKDINDVLHSSDIDKYTKSRTNNSLKIEFDTDYIHDYNIQETSEAYEMLKDYLFETYDLIPNYVYINYHWNYMYFQNFDKIKEYKSIFSKGVLGSEDKNIFKAHKLIFGFYEDLDDPFRGPEF